MADIDRYFLVRDGQTYGPFGSAEFVGFEANRRVGPNDLILREGDDPASARPWSDVRRDFGLSEGIPPITSPPTVRPTFDGSDVPTPERNRGLEVLVPVNLSPWSLVAPWVGIAGFFTLGLLGPVAIALGIVAWRTLKPGQAGMARAIVALVLGSLSSLLGIGLAAAVLLG